MKKSTIQARGNGSSGALRRHSQQQEGVDRSPAGSASLRPTIDADGVPAHAVRRYEDPAWAHSRREQAVPKDPQRRYVARTIAHGILYAVPLQFAKVRSLAGGVHDS